MNDHYHSFRKSNKRLQFFYFSEQKYLLIILPKTSYAPSKNKKWMGSKIFILLEKLTPLNVSISYNRSKN